MSSSGDKKAGEIISAECKDGPVLERGCTDLCCFFIFTAVFVALFGVAIYGFVKGNPTLLYTPMDPDGSFCGYSSNATDYPYIYFVAPSISTLYRTTCVKTCPTASSTTLDCLVNSLVPNCSGIVVAPAANSTNSISNGTSNSSATTTSSNSTASSTVNTNSTTKTTNSTATTTTSSKTTVNATSTNSSKTIAIQTGAKRLRTPKNLKEIILTIQGKKKAVTLKHLTTAYNYSSVILIYPSVGYMGSVCLPRLQTYLDAVLSSLNLDAFLDTVEDLENTWKISLACCGIAVLIGFVFMVFTRFCAKFIVWLFILFFIFSLLALGVIYLMKAENVTLNLSSTWASVSSVIDQVQSTTSSTTTTLCFGLVFIGVAVILIILVSCFFSRIKLATAIIESAALFVGQNPSSFLVPIFNFLTIIVWFIFAILGFLWIVSTGDVTYAKNHLPYGNFKLNSTGQILAWFFFVGALWVFAFILHMANFIFGLATSFWYFERMQKKTTHPIWQSTKWFFRYHVGSVALGSGIITIVWLLQQLLSLIAKQQKKSQNKCGEYCIKCCQCIVNCFERFIEYLTKNAYTYVGMTAKNFLPSAWAVFSMVLRNPLRFSVTGFLGEIFQLFGEGFICLFTAFIGYEIIINDASIFEKLNSTVWPTIVFAFVGFVVGSLFMTVYGAVADAILVVFVLDEEIHKNHLGKLTPENVPKPLQDFVKQAEEHNSAFQDK